MKGYLLDTNICIFAMRSLCSLVHYFSTRKHSFQTLSICRCINSKAPMCRF